MQHHEESPEKPQYNMATSHFKITPLPFCIIPDPLLAKFFRAPKALPPTSLNFENVDSPLRLYEGT